MAQPTQNSCWWTSMRMILGHFGHHYPTPGDYCEGFRPTSNSSVDPNLPSAWYQLGIPPTAEAMRLFNRLIRGGDAEFYLRGQGIRSTTQVLTLRGARAYPFRTVDHGVQSSFGREQILSALQTHGPFMVIRRTPTNWAHVVVVTGVEYHIGNPNSDTTQIRYADPDGGLGRSSSERAFLQAMCDFTGIFGEGFPLSLRGENSNIRPMDVTV